MRPSVTTYDAFAAEELRDLVTLTFDLWSLSLVIYGASRTQPVHQAWMTNDYLYFELRRSETSR